MSDTGLDFNTIEEHMLYSGKQLLPQFTLTDPVMWDMYELVCCGITEGGAPYPFSNTRSRSAAELGIDPAKGILLLGTAGVGKTVLFNILQQLIPETDMQFTTVTQNALSARVNRDKAGKHEVVYEYGMHLREHLLVDEIDPDREYKDLKRTMRYLIAERYKLHWYKGYRTHFSMIISTNGKDDLPVQAQNFLLRVYGRYIYTLLADMCNILVWEGANLRTGSSSLAGVHCNQC